MAFIWVCRQFLGLMRIVKIIQPCDTISVFDAQSNTIHDKNVFVIRGISTDALSEICRCHCGGREWNTPLKASHHFCNAGLYRFSKSAVKADCSSLVKSEKRVLMPGGLGALVLEYSGTFVVIATTAFVVVSTTGLFSLAGGLKKEIKSRLATAVKRTPE